MAHPALWRIAYYEVTSKDDCTRTLIDDDTDMIIKSIGCVTERPAIEKPIVHPIMSEAQRKQAARRQKLGKRQVKVLEFVRQNGACMFVDICTELQCSSGSLWSSMDSLHRDGYVRISGSTKHRGKDYPLWVVT